MTRFSSYTFCEITRIMNLKKLSFACTLLLLFFISFSLSATNVFLHESELRETIVGYTLQGKNWAEYYSPEGKIFGKSRTFGLRSYTGRWVIQSDRVCYDYQSSLFNTCSQLKLVDGRVHHHAINGELKNDGIAKRIQGNKLDSF